MDSFEKDKDNTSNNKKWTHSWTWTLIRTFLASQRDEISQIGNWGAFWISVKD